MTKQELLQFFKDQSGLEFGDRSVAQHFTNCFNSLTGQLFSRDPGQYSFYCKRMKLDVVNRVAKITFPLMQNVSNSKGIVRIYPTGAECSCLPDDTEFWPAPNFTHNSSADANNLSWAVFYTVTSREIKFNRALNKDVTELYADCVVEFSAYGNDEYIPLPAGIAQMIVDATISSIKGDPSHKNIYKPPPA